MARPDQWTSHYNMGNYYLNRGELKKAIASYAFRNRVPFSIYLVLFVISAITLWLVGYYFGRRGQRAQILTTMLVLLVASVMWLIMDLDQPLRGAIRASQQSLIDLHQDLSRTSQDTPKKSQ